MHKIMKKWTNNFFANENYGFVVTYKRKVNNLGLS